MKFIITSSIPSRVVIFIHILYIYAIENTIYSLFLRPLHFSNSANITPKAIAHHHRLLHSRGLLEFRCVIGEGKKGRNCQPEPHQINFCSKFLNL